MGRFTNLFSDVEVSQESVTHEVAVEEPVVVVEELETESVVEISPPKPLNNLVKPSLRRTHK